MSAPGSQTYIIRGGEKGRARLRVLSRLLAPSTGLLIDRIGSITGANAVDLGCGGGDVTLDLARRVGPGGRVWGLDLDAAILDMARAEAKKAGRDNVTFVQANIADEWRMPEASLVYARFILTHVPDPQAVLAQARRTLAPGGAILIEDIDMEGRFWDPPSAALTRLTDLYVAAATKRGGDPFIGRKLVGMLETAGFDIAQSSLVQPFGRDGDIKEMAMLDFANIADALVDGGFLGRPEALRLGGEVDAFARRADTTISLPRIFQAWARKV